MLHSSLVWFRRRKKPLMLMDNRFYSCESKNSNLDLKIAKSSVKDLRFIVTPTGGLGKLICFNSPFPLLYDGRRKILIEKYIQPNGTGGNELPRRIQRMLH